MKVASDKHKLHKLLYCKHGKFKFRFSRHLYYANFLYPNYLRGVEFANECPCFYMT